MKIKDDDYVVVFKLNCDMAFKSYWSSLEIELNYGDLVAVFEEKPCIFYGDVSYQIAWNVYTNLTDTCDVFEMTYKEYLTAYRKNLNMLNSNAPTIFEINNDNAPSQSTTLYGAKITFQRN